MQDDLNRNVDYTQILAIQQKRTVAFVNHFIMNTVEFLNNFANSCESRFIDFEYKIQKVEAALLILENQLSSIQGLENQTNNNNVVESTENVSKTEVPLQNVETHEKNQEIELEPEKIDLPKEQGIRACEDTRFSKYFKMVQVGVPLQAAKLKMLADDLDPTILDTPNAVIPV